METKEYRKKFNANVKRLSDAGVEYFNEVKKILAIRYANGDISKMPYDGQILEKALEIYLKNI